MPCDAIAVAKGQVPLDLARELDGLGTETVAQALLALLCRRFAHLGQPELTPLWGAHSEPALSLPKGARTSGIGVRIGNVLVRVSPDWRVTVNTRRRAGAGDDQTVQQVRDAVTGLLTSLADLAIQRRVAQAVPQAGYRVTDQTRAQRRAGAERGTVEEPEGRESMKARVVITASGQVSVFVDEGTLETGREAIERFFAQPARRGRCAPSAS